MPLRQWGPEGDGSTRSAPGYVRAERRTREPFSLYTAEAVRLTGGVGWGRWGVYTGDVASVRKTGVDEASVWLEAKKIFVSRKRIIRE